MGLEEQLLIEVVKHERPDLEKARIDIIQQSIEDNVQLIRLEDNILLQINQLKGMILETDQIINLLQSTKVIQNTIMERITQ